MRQFFTLRHLREGSNLLRLPKDVVDAPSLEVFKARLDGALGSLSWCVTALPTAEGWSWTGFEVLSMIL